MSRLLNQSLLNLATIFKLHHRSSDKILKVFIPGKTKTIWKKGVGVGKGVNYKDRGGKQRRVFIFPSRRI